MSDEEEVPMISMRLSEWLGHQAPDVQGMMRQIRAEALEEAARECDLRVHNEAGALLAAAAIRALKDNKP